MQLTFNFPVNMKRTSFWTMACGCGKMDSMRGLDDFTCEIHIVNIHLKININPEFSRKKNYHFFCFLGIHISMIWLQI